MNQSGNFSGQHMTGGINRYCSGDLDNIKEKGKDR